MQKLALLLFAFLLPAVALDAQVPRFSQFSATVERTRAKKVDFRGSPGASTFRTRLNQAFREGTDFAGHYKVAGWGCGTGCISGAVIDTRNGRVYFPIELYALSVGWFSGEYESKPLKYRSNSRMLILSGIPGSEDGAREQPWGDYYYEWKNNRFRQLKYVRRDNPQ